jgi:hypothetical protein
MIKDNKELLYELTLDGDGDEVFAVSFVAEPAIERDFIYLNKAEVKFQAIDNDKHLVAGPLLIPDKKILRLDEKNQPYYVFFKPSTIEQIAQKYLSKKYNDSVTYEHSTPVKDVSLVESWVVESPTKDKSNIYGFTMPKGTWFGIFKVNNPELWADVKAGKVKGFSIEGAFEHKEAMMSAVLEKDIENFTEEEAEIFLGMVKNIIKKDKRYSKGEKLVEESHSDYGSAIKSNAKRGIALNEKNGNKCATQVGKVRAQQLAKGEPISVDTIKRMYSYLSRAEVYYDNADKNSDCGYISFLLWGGKSGLSWSRNKLRKLGLLTEAEAQPSISSSYPGETSKKKKDYIHPALIGEKK